MRSRIGFGSVQRVEIRRARWKPFLLYGRHLASNSVIVIFYIFYRSLWYL